MLAVPILAQTARVKTLNIRVLSTMLADSAGVGEWGFAAIVEADGHPIPFDTGARPETVLNSGLMTLRRAVMQKNSKPPVASYAACSWSM